MTDRIKFAYLTYGDMLSKLESGEINEYDIIYSKDQYVTYLITEDLQPLQLRSRVYVFDSIDEAELAIPADLRTDRVPSRYKTLIEASLADLGYTLENSVGVETTNTANISKNYTKLDGTVVNEKYSYESLLPGQDNNVEKSVENVQNCVKYGCFSGCIFVMRLFYGKCGAAHSFFRFAEK